MLGGGLGDHGNGNNVVFDVVNLLNVPLATSAPFLATPRAASRDLSHPREPTRRKSSNRASGSGCE